MRMAAEGWVADIGSSLHDAPNIIGLCMRLVILALVSALAALASPGRTEEPDWLRNAVFEDLEVILQQVVYGVAFGVSD